MSDEIKKTALLEVMCVECLETRRYRIEDGKNEAWYCPHKRTLTTWRQDLEPHGLTFFDVDDQEFFATVREARELADRAKAQREASQN
ncbi:MAG: hypothetical protein KC588_02130 [Nitrospira sp.]|nr:hypothetical protein [Nitrospira sp.]